MHYSTSTVLQSYKITNLEPHCKTCLLTSWPYESPFLSEFYPPSLRWFNLTFSITIYSKTKLCCLNNQHGMHSAAVKQHQHWSALRLSFHPLVAAGQEAAQNSKLATDYKLQLADAYNSIWTSILNICRCWFVILHAQYR